MASIWSRSTTTAEGGGTEPPLKDSTDAKLSTSEAGFRLGHPVKKDYYYSCNIDQSQPRIKGRKEPRRCGGGGLRLLRSSEAAIATAAGG